MASGIRFPSAGRPGRLPAMATADALASEILRHLLTIVGFLLAVFLIARLMSEKRQPGNTVAWLLGIVLVPYVGVPLYLIFGGRKLRRLAARKSRLAPAIPVECAATSVVATGPTARSIARAAGSLPLGGNSVRFLATGEEAYSELERRICEARQTINLMTFILGRDATGRRVGELLAQRAREGVKVRLLLDSVGCLFSSRGFAAPVREAGGEVHRFMPVLPFQFRGSANLRNHRKIAVFDGQTAILGGHNIALEYMGWSPFKRRWRDLGAVIEGPAVDLLNGVFMADWSYASGRAFDASRVAPRAKPVASGSGELQVVASGPDVPGEPLYEGILSFLQEAERSICIVTPYFIPDEVLFRSLLIKAHTGRRVRLVVPARSNHRVAYFARRYYLRELQKAGAEVLLYANFDMRSLFVNFEIGVFVYSAPEIEGLRAWVDQLADHSTPLAADRSPRRRVLGNLAEDVSRLFAPLL